MQRYLDQLALSLRPASVARRGSMLRQFAGFLTDESPDVVRLVDVERHHVEGFKRHLGTRLSQNDTGHDAVTDDDPDHARHAAHVLRTRLGMGLPRRPDTGADLQR